MRWNYFEGYREGEVGGDGDRVGRDWGKELMKLEGFLLWGCFFGDYCLLLLLYSICDDILSISSLLFLLFPTGVNNPCGDPSIIPSPIPIKLLSLSCSTSSSNSFSFICYNLFGSYDAVRFSFRFWDILSSWELSGFEFFRVSLGMGKRAFVGH